MNMKRLFISLSMLLYLCIPLKAMAGPYVGVQYSVQNYSEDGLTGEYALSAIIARLGMTFTPRLGVELRVASGVGDATNREFIVVPVDLTVSIDSMVGVYATYNHSLSKTSKLYGFVGATDYTTPAEALVVGTTTVIPVEVSDTSFSFGFGVDIGLMPRMALNLEYASYINATNVSMGGGSMGITYSF